MNILIRCPTLMNQRSLVCTRMPASPANNRRAMQLSRPFWTFKGSQSSQKDQSSQIKDNRSVMKEMKLAKSLALHPLLIQLSCKLHHMRSAKPKKIWTRLQKLRIPNKRSQQLMKQWLKWPKSCTNRDHNPSAKRIMRKDYSKWTTKDFFIV